LYNNSQLLPKESIHIIVSQNPVVSHHSNESDDLPPTDQIEASNTKIERPFKGSNHHVFITSIEKDDDHMIR